MGDKVLKFKKPVRTDFLDFTGVEARRRACDDEVRLNRRLSPDVYLGVADIDLGGGQCEPAVVMRRLDDRDCLAALVGGESRRVADGIDAVARRIATLHEGSIARTDESSPGSWRRTLARWQREWDVLEVLNPSFAPSYRRGAGRRLGIRYLVGRRELFDRRVHDGKIREGHGDLRADHVYVTDDGVRIVDCLEFDAELRTCDVLADVGFLAMDLERLGEEVAAAALFAAHRGQTGDVYPQSLVDFYLAQRALIRLKVALMRPGPRTRAGIKEEDRLLELAESHLVAAQPVLACVGGLPGSGKSTLAAALATRSDLVYLSSDAVRHESSPRRVAVRRDGWGEGRYRESAVASVYDELLRRARTALGLGYSVVLDASWRDAVQRDKARRLAEQAAAVLVEIHCMIDDETAVQRLSERRTGFSEAGAMERHSMQRSFAPWPDAHLIFTDGAVADSVAVADEALAAAKLATIERDARAMSQLCEVTTAEPAAPGKVDDR